MSELNSDFKSRFSVFVVGMLFISIQAGARPEISIPENIEISQRELLRLSDIAEISGGDAETLSFAESVVIREDARKLLLSQKLEAQELLHKIRSAMNSRQGSHKLSPSFKIPSQIKVRFSTQPLSREEIGRKIFNNLKTQCSECEYRVSIQSVPVPTQKQWELDFGQFSHKGGFLLPLKESGQSQSKWISGTIRVSRLTPVTTRLILQGERVQPEDIRMIMTDVTYSKDGVLRIEDIQGQIAARSLPIGSAVWTTDLKREPAAKKGQIVKALLGDESFEISTNMLAEDSGFVGDLIKVKNLDNQKVLSGLIVEKGVVKLQ